MTRPVIAQKFISHENGKNLYEPRRATFHQFAVSYEEFDNGVGNYPVAIVEWDDGSVGIVSADQIQFLDVTNNYYKFRSPTSAQHDEDLVEVIAILLASDSSESPASFVDMAHSVINIMDRWCEPRFIKKHLTSLDPQASTQQDHPLDDSITKLIECDTCKGEGTIDERLGGIHTSNPAAVCPDCDGTGETRLTSRLYQQIRSDINKLTRDELLHIWKSNFSDTPQDLFLDTARAIAILQDRKDLESAIASAELESNIRNLRLQSVFTNPQP